ncbi:hypothetical protein B7494_g5838 [Chlorociboria aeruginascens]|nr:hypothetical protein B7494_g5838 [Chlorociboria aeruginascens]
MASQSPDLSAQADVKAELDEEKPTVIPTATNPASVSKETLELMDAMEKRLTDYRDADGVDISNAFQRIVNKRVLPDYFDIIKEPVAFSTGKILKKQYKSFKEFVRDFALMSHNAQVYNRPSAPVYGDAIALRELVKAELQKLVDQMVITAEESEFPDLGEIPDIEDSPLPAPEDEEVEEDEDEEEEEEDEDDSDDDGPKRRARKKGRRASATGGKRDGGKIDESKDDPESQKKRGRPPKVHTPMEARINNVLKGLRKFKNPGGDLKIFHFEKLPDKSAIPDYYHEIKVPIAMDLIKRKAKRKKYHSVDQALKDLELMFENAKAYNEEGSQVYKDAVDLQREARILAEQEKKKPDGEYADEDGRLPVPEILYNGELWKVGDWIHLNNPNDVTKPIVAQIYRTWQDPEGQKWINACWYYRPEQTVHRYEKHFYENEVVKTGQYRDHKIEEVVDRCFVMFFTRYNKGRPRGFPTDKEVYVCEARYNEDRCKLNKIKTWASCVPDEVRDKDYEMDLFEVPRKMKKVPSPIKHLLREDAKEDDPLPKPTWGVANAPPIVGAVHRRPRESNESPPPEPTPSPPPQPLPEPVRRPPPVTTERPRYGSQGDITMSGTHSGSAASPMNNLNLGSSSYGQQFASSRPITAASPSPHPPQNPYGTHGQPTQSALPQTPQYQPQSSYSHYGSAATTPATQLPNPLGNYSHYQNNTPRAPAPAPASHGSQTNAYNPPRPVEVYTLSDQANLSIPPDTRSQFHQDEAGRVIFFTAPPLDVNPVSEQSRNLGHSLRYLAEKARRTEEIQKQRKDRAAELELEASTRLKRMKTDDDDKKQQAFDQKMNYLQNWCKNMEAGTDELYKQMHGEKWKEMRELDAQALVAKQQEAYNKRLSMEKAHKKQDDGENMKITAFKWV